MNTNSLNILTNAEQLIMGIEQGAPEGGLQHVSMQLAQSLGSHKSYSQLMQLAPEELAFYLLALYIRHCERQTAFGG